MRTVRWLFLVSLWPGVAYPLFLCPFDRLAQVEKELSRVVVGRPPIPHYELEPLREDYRAVEAKLIELGVDYVAGAKHPNHFPCLRNEVDSGDATGPHIGGDWLFRVRGPLKSARPEHADPLAPWLTHPGSQALMARLRKLGASVYVDPTLTHADSIGGQFAEGAILLEPHTSFITFVHEATHAEFWRFKMHDFLRRARVPHLNKQQLKSLLHQHRGFGRERLLKARQWALEGYTDLGIEERLCIEEELKILHPTIHADAVKWVQDYARGILLEGLATQGMEKPLSPAEKRTFLKNIAADIAGDGSSERQTEFELASLFARLLDAEKPGEGNAKLFDGVEFKIYRTQKAKDDSENAAIGYAIVGVALGKLVVSLGKGLFAEITLPADDDDEKTADAFKAGAEKHPPAKSER